VAPFRTSKIILLYGWWQIASQVQVGIFGEDMRNIRLPENPNAF
jgi:hypothetical protein